MKPATLSLVEARRIALAAAGLGAAPPRGRSREARLRSVFDDLSLVQLDAVNAVARSHDLVLFARLGEHPPSLVHDLSRRGVLFEQWYHEASLVPADVHPLLRFRMKEREAKGLWGTFRALATRPEKYLDDVLAEVRARGPLRVSDLSDPGKKTGPWWGWSQGKHALEYLFAMGRVAALRAPSFERLYEVTERVLPPAVLAMPTPPVDVAKRRLLERGARAMGIGTWSDVCDHPRLRPTHHHALRDALVEDGVLVPVRVEGIREAMYLHRDAKVPPPSSRAALLSPFDPVVWCRPRAERLFGFRYRIELYTPEEKRVFGYYVMPLLVGDRLVGRVDVRADRAAGKLRAPRAFVEDGVSPREVRGVLHDELAKLAAWLGLEAPKRVPVVKGA